VTRDQKVLVFLAMLVAGLYSLTAIVGLKTVAIGPVIFAAGGLFVAVIKPVVDVVNELYGRRTAAFVVWGMASVRTCVYAGMFAIALLPTFKQPPGFRAVLMGGVLLFLASVSAELFASLAINLPVFTWLKAHTRLGFVLRSYISKVSLLIQAAIFATLYVLLNPHVPWGPFFLGQFVVVAVISLVLAPVAALVVRTVKR